MMVVTDQAGTWTPAAVIAKHVRLQPTYVEVAAE